MNVVRPVDLLWRLAVHEAVAAKSQFVEPAHFLEALTKGRQCCSDAATKELAARGIDAQGFRSELTLVPDALDAVGIKPDEYRRAIRAMLGTGNYQHKSGEILTRHRIVVT